MHILILNWRDIKNPWAGGAEVVTHEHAKRWVKAGLKVTQFSSMFKGAKKEENVDGVNIIRGGGPYTVYYSAYKHYNSYFKGKFDLVIDEVNTIPFFTPLYVKEPKLMFIHQLARKVWFYETKFPISLLGYTLEPLYLRFYKNLPAMVVSESTKTDLIKLGIKNVEVIPEGKWFKALDKIPKKEENPTIIYVGRLKKSKRVHDIINAFSIVNKKITNSKLWIIGSGDSNYLYFLKDKIRKNGLIDNVKFFGKVNEDEKINLMSRAHIIAVASVREGWGLIVTEANACGTPAVGYNIPGLRDSIKDNKTGLLTDKNTPKDLASKMIELLTDKKKLINYSKNALIDSRKYNWDKAAMESLKVIKKVIK